jgi:hypothetical protein
VKSRNPGTTIPTYSRVHFRPGLELEPGIWEPRDYHSYSSVHFRPGLELEPGIWETGEQGLPFLLEGPLLPGAGTGTWNLGNRGAGTTIPTRGSTFARPRGWNSWKLEPENPGRTTFLLSSSTSTLPPGLRDGTWMAHARSAHFLYLGSVCRSYLDPLSPGAGTGTWNLGTAGGGLPCLRAMYSRRKRSNRQWRGEALSA